MKSKKSSHILLIYYLNRHNEINGAVTHTIDTAIALQKQNIPVYIKTACAPFFDEAKRNKLNVSRLRLGTNPDKKFRLSVFILYALYALPRLTINLLYYRLIKGVTTLYIISKIDKLIGTPIAQLLGMRVIWIEHALFSSNVNTVYKKLYTRLSPKIQIITDSNAVKFQLIEDWGVPNNRVKTIYPGIDARDYKASQSTIVTDYTKKLERKFVVGVVCRLSKEKGVEFLIKAIASLTNAIPNIHLVIVGDGSEKEHLQWIVQTKELEKYVSFVGFQKNLKSWYPLFDLFVLPSTKKESFGTVLLEAMYFHVPVIATNLGGLPEIIEDGKTGILIPPADSQAIAQTILQLKDDKDRVQEIAEQAADMVQERFTKERMLEEFYELITKEG